jgi:hypothetical protein
MKFSEIANRLTGISTPFGGVSWQSADAKANAASSPKGDSHTGTVATIKPPIK